MNGSQAFKYLSKMTEEERKGVYIVWLDKEMASNFQDPDGDKKEQFFSSLPPAVQGDMLYEATCDDNGDFSPEFGEFLDGFSSRLEEAVEKKMKEEKGDENGEK